MDDVKGIPIITKEVYDSTSYITQTIICNESHSDLPM